MGYHSTRNSVTVYTAGDILLEERAEDGGCYVPGVMPRPMKDADIATFAWLSHGRRLAHLFAKFGCGPDFNNMVEMTESIFTKEDYGVNTTPVTEREGLCYLELTQGPTGKQADFFGPVLFGLGGGADENGNSWAAFLCRVTVWVSAYCEMVLRRHIKFGKSIEICVGTGYDDLSAALFVKSMGLPVEKIIYIGDIPLSFKNGLEPGYERVIYELSGRDCNIVLEASRSGILPDTLIKKVSDNIQTAMSVSEAANIVNSGNRILVLE